MKLMMTCFYNTASPQLASQQTSEILINLNDTPCERVGHVMLVGWHLVQAVWVDTPCVISTKHCALCEEASVAAKE
jgi:hypothetical protein